MKNLIPNSDKKAFNGVTYDQSKTIYKLMYTSVMYTGGISFYFLHPKDNIFYYCAKINCNEKHKPYIFNGLNYTFDQEVGEDPKFVSFRSKALGSEQRVIFYVPKKAEMTLDEVVAINLTATFGEGHEPTKEQMDYLVKRIGYFETKEVAVLI